METTDCLGANCFHTDLPDGGSGRRPGASVVSSASMSVLHSSSLRDYSPASRSANQDSLQVVSLALGARLLLLCPVVSFFFFLWWKFCFNAKVQRSS